MLTKAQIKVIKALDDRKSRREQGVFVVEGDKLVREALQQGRYIVKKLYAMEEWCDVNSKALQGKTFEIISSAELKQISNLNTPNQALALLELGDYSLEMSALKSQLAIGLDCVQDPGNLGTIIRIADWFGIDHIICSSDTVDVYNSKVLQSTMGSIFRVQVHYTELSSFVEAYSKELKQPVYGALLEGNDVFETKLASYGLLLMGNESRGLSDKLRKLVTEPLLIPQYRPGAESLNVGVATGILCAVFRNF